MERSKNILIPLDLMRSPCDSLEFARHMATEAPISVTLLYVLNLQVVTPGRQIYDELCAESEKALRKLAWFFFGSDEAARIVVRVGQPDSEIVAEARAQSADLILLNGPERRSWMPRLRRGTAEKILDSSPCPAMVLPRQPSKPSKAPKAPAAREDLLAA